MRQHFLIVGTQRTGSQALYRGLNLHPDVFCGGEWTHHVLWARKLSAAKRALTGDFRDILVHRPQDRERILKTFRPETRWLGFKILFRSSDKWLGHPRFAPALMLDRLEGHLTWLSSRPDIQIIHLVRRGMIEWLKSKYLARATRTFTQTKYPERFKVTIPIRPALRAATAKRWVDSRLSTLASSNPYCLVYYEDFLADNRQALYSCLEFLHCDQNKLPDDGKFIQRQSKGTAADYIRNYDELVAALEVHQLLASTVSGSIT